MADVQSTTLRLGEERKKEEKDIEEETAGQNIMACPIP